jgi:hypothetical protein
VAASEGLAAAEDVSVALSDGVAEPGMHATMERAASATATRRNIAGS